MNSLSVNDENGPQVAQTKLLPGTTKYRIKDDDEVSEATVSIKSAKHERPNKRQFSMFANPHKVSREEESESESDSDESSDISEESDEQPPNTMFANVPQKDPNEGIKKRKLLIGLKRLERDRGIEISSGINERSSLEELQLEYDMHKSYLDIEDTKALYRMWLITFANTTEFVSGVWNPVGVKLKGWSGHLNENIEEFDQVFGELAEKYGSGSTPPEIRLMFLLGQSAFMYHMNNKLMDMMGGGALKNIEKALQNSSKEKPPSQMKGPGDILNTMGGGSFNPLQFMNDLLKPSPPPKREPEKPAENKIPLNVGPSISTPETRIPETIIQETRIPESRPVPITRPVPSKEDHLSQPVRKLRSVTSTSKHSDNSSESSYDSDIIKEIQFKKPLKRKKQVKKGLQL